MNSKYLEMFKSLMKGLDSRNWDDKMKRLPRNNVNKYRWGPWKPLPNVVRFKVNLKGYDETFKAHGVLKRLESEKWYLAFRNQQMNRYLRHQISRLERYRDGGNHKAYWVVAGQLLSRSVIFALQSIHHVYPRYHRELQYQTVLRMIWGMHALARQDEPVMKHFRAYVPKANGKWRPLGVPTPIWRIYLHQLNNLLYFFFEKHVLPNQHGFLPGRGTLTAWIDILSSVIHKPDIYEFDYKGFFDNVVTNEVLQLMLRWGLPRVWYKRLSSMSRSVPVLTEEDKCEEDSRRYRQQSDGTISPNWRNKSRPPEELHPGIPQSLMLALMKEDMEDLDGVSDGWIKANYETVYVKYVELQWAYLSSFNVAAGVPVQDISQTPFMTQLSTEVGWKEKGFPQGAATSPFLSILPLFELDRTVNLHRSKLRYADDYLEFPTGGATKQWQHLPREAVLLKNHPAYEKYGIRISREKSGWVKKDGKWKKPLKFLGLIYDGERDTLRAQTRDYSFEGGKESSELSIHTKDELLSTLLRGPLSLMKGPKVTYVSGWRIRSESLSRRYNWESLVNSSIFGFFQSRMYSGDWNVAFDQSFELTFKEGSWVHWYRKAQSASSDHPSLTVFNSTSVAAYTISHHIRSINKHRAAWRRFLSDQSSYEDLCRTLSQLGMKRPSVGSVMRSIAFAIASGRLTHGAGTYLIEHSGLVQLLGKGDRHAFRYLRDLVVKARKSPKIRKSDTHVLDKTVNVDDSNDYSRYLWENSLVESDYTSYRKPVGFTPRLKGGLRAWTQQELKRQASGLWWLKNIDLRNAYVDELRDRSNLSRTVDSAPVFGPGGKVKYNPPK